MFLLRSSSGMELKVMRRINWYKNSKKTFPLKLETLQKNVTNGHVNGSETLLWPDFHCCCILDMLSQHFGINMADCPELKKVYDGVVAEPNIKKWLEERPKTDH